MNLLPKLFIAAIIAFFLTFGVYLYSYDQKLTIDDIYARLEFLKESLTESIQAVPEQNLGSGFNPAGGLTYRLKSSIGTTNTSIVLSSLKNRTDIPLTMTLLGTDIGYATLDPQSTRSEFISFTGITQNSDGSATVTGVLRGISDIFPFVASTTMAEAHSGQSIFILSDSPALFDEYTKRRSNEWITGVWGFGSLPTSSVPCTSSTQFCNKAYMDGLAIQGAGTSSESAMGIVQLALANEVGSSTASSTEGRPLVVTTRYATTSPVSSECDDTPCVVASYYGKLSQSWLNLAENFSLTGTTTLSKLVFGTISWNPFTGTAATGTAPVVTSVNNGNISTTFQGVCRLVAVSTTTVGLAGSTNEILLLGINVPADTFGTLGVLKGRFSFSGEPGSSRATTTIRAYYGASAFAAAGAQWENTTWNKISGIIELGIQATSSELFQSGWLQYSAVPTISESDSVAGGGSNWQSVGAIGTTSVMSVDSTAQQQFRLTAQTTQTTADLILTGGELTICR